MQPQVPFDFAQGRLFDFGYAFAQDDTLFMGSRFMGSSYEWV